MKRVAVAIAIAIGTQLFGVSVVLAGPNSGNMSGVTTTFASTGDCKIRNQFWKQNGIAFSETVSIGDNCDSVSSTLVQSTGYEWTTGLNPGVKEASIAVSENPNTQFVSGFGCASDDGVVVCTTG